MKCKMKWNDRLKYAQLRHKQTNYCVASQKLLKTMIIHTKVAIIITRHMLLNTLIKHYEFTILVQIMFYFCSSLVAQFRWWTASRTIVSLL